MTTDASPTIEEEITIIAEHLSRLSSGPVQIKAEFWSREAVLTGKKEEKPWSVYLGRFEMSEHFESFADLKYWYLKQAGKTKVTE